VLLVACTSQMRGINIQTMMLRYDRLLLLDHTFAVQHGLRYGMILFIVSEIVFF